MNSILLKISVQLFLPPFLAFLSISLFPFCLWITLYISAGQALHRRTQVLFKTARKLCRMDSGCMMGEKKPKDETNLSHCSKTQGKEEERIVARG
jgi:hypothetical protein